MAHLVTAHAEILPDHTMVLKMPEDIPPGPVTVTLTVEPEGESNKINTLGDFLNSEFFGMFSDRDDLPKTNGEFREWRRKISEGEPY